MTDQILLLSQICELNAQGVLALASGKAGKSSVTLLRQAMLCMDQLCAVAPDGALSSQPSVPLRTIPLPIFQDEHFYIFNHAFVLDMPAQQQLSSVNMAYCCAVLTFNMALTYHQIGRELGDSRKLRAACHLYGNCVEMTGSVQGVPPPSAGDKLFLLQMMAMNNASQIQYSLAKFAESHHLLCHVRQMMQQIFERNNGVEPLPANDAVAYLPAEALDEVNLNAVVCVYPSTAPMA